MRPDNLAGAGHPTGDLDHDRMLADIAERAEKLRHTAAGVAATLAETTGTGRSPDGVVTATVSPTGALQDVQLSARASSLNPTQLSRSIMAAVRAAQSQASQAMVSAFAPLGEGTDTLNMILEHIPKADEPDDQPERDLAAVEETVEEPVGQTPEGTAPRHQPPPPPAPANPPPRRRPAPADDEDDNAPW